MLALLPAFALVAYLLAPTREPACTSQVDPGNQIRISRTRRTEMIAVRSKDSASTDCPRRAPRHPDAHQLPALPDRRRD